MKDYLLDTNVCIAILKNNHAVFRKVLAAGQKHCHISEITIAELYYGAAKSGKKHQFDDIAKIKSLFEIIPMYSSLKTYGDIKATLEQKGKRLDDFDLLIGATALQNKMCVVTGNIKHLSRIPNIEVVNWEATAEV